NKATGTCGLEGSSQSLLARKLATKLTRPLRARPSGPFTPPGRSCSCRGSGLPQVSAQCGPASPSIAARRYLGDWGRPSYDALASPQSPARSLPEGLPLPLDAAGGGNLHWGTSVVDSDTYRTIPRRVPRGEGNAESPGD